MIVNSIEQSADMSMVFAREHPSPFAAYSEEFFSVGQYVFPHKHIPSDGPDESDDAFATLNGKDMLNRRVNELLNRIKNHPGPRLRKRWAFLLLDMQACAPTFIPRPDPTITPRYTNEEALRVFKVCHT